jgi:hypothetical protein
MPSQFTRAALEILMVASLVAGCSSSPTRAQPLCREGKRLADVGIVFDGHAGRATEIVTRYQFGQELPGGHDTDYLSAGKHQTVFVYLRAPLSASGRRQLRSALLKIDGIKAVQFGVLQSFGIRTAGDGC